MVTLALELVPGLSPAPTLQRYVRNGNTFGAIVGTAITGVVDGTYTHVWNFDVTSWAVGDYAVLLDGVSVPNRLPWPCRVNSSGAYPGDSWEILDATIIETPIIPPSGTSGMCNVLFFVRNGSTPIEDATVNVFLEERNNTINDVVISRTVITGLTDSDGYLTLSLVRFATFTSGGIYRVRISDPDGKRMIDRRVLVPNLSSVNFEDTEEAE